ncbi:MAG: glutamine-hydrolyzing GMP synthase [Deltaproteobacteria bacterium]|nr:glutamine-hydrolyzing GMP synthase [Deltaproteobacteria bacterium]MCL5276875.1 glutamine-hydrolyzing GMP synthase [Deltaproteobacteria bacterium]
MIESIVILDFGSQYTQLISRRIRELGIYSQILPYDTPLERIRDLNAKGIILSGSPFSVYQKAAPKPDDSLFDTDVPLLGICYGMQYITDRFGGTVQRSRTREYGRAEIEVTSGSPVFDGMDRASKHTVWMSHSDRIEKLPEGFEVIASSENSPIAGFQHSTRPVFGLQFHPEVSHTVEGMIILKNFAILCGIKEKWNLGEFIDRTVAEIRQTVGQDRVIGAISGGVDSTVASVLTRRAIGKRLKLVFIDNGLLRESEPSDVMSAFRAMGLGVQHVDASSLFLRRLRGVTDPEKKRKIIGKTFIDVFDRHAHGSGVQWLLQGTLYPDVIESTPYLGPSQTIKSHHNVGGLPAAMRLKVIEPLRLLFKDEVRVIGRMLGIPDAILARQPFPGPGLGIRILGEVRRGHIDMLKKADRVVREEIEKYPLSMTLWQYFAVLLPIKTVGIMGDERTYEYVVAVRVVSSSDAMTADWARLPHELMDRLSSRIISEVDGINRVVYDISSKPPSTIEWE